jgi:hypothetical protein
MQWKKTRITINIWTEGCFKITEDNEQPPESRFRLDCFDGSDSPEYFSTLKSAQHAAALRNELAITREEVERLRAELSNRKQGDQFERTAEKKPAVAIARSGQILTDYSKQDDGRGIPKVEEKRPVSPLDTDLADDIAADLMKVMHRNQRLGGENTSPADFAEDPATDMATGPRLAYAGSDEIPF